ncbi:stress responsive A/B barrel domain-containing protein [Suillus clintonianus]|uniref:stress responsive A/B barrel domain-containing protein n=1 Tax=Suillus clintonianus TaxID=1904413 RepID=UPI001B862B7E|nr:stress responsive A/B barrel domain-containing protein [Suillus clintonianus]KAG2151355.1 stress responsive A/B barrel domain-containing protein [Suillus clintonianus]
MTIHHIAHSTVLYKFKPETTPEQKQSVRDSVSALPSQIPAIQSLITGETVFNPLGHGYDEGVIFVFESVAKLDEYRPHKAHLDYQAFAGPFMEESSSEIPSSETLAIIRGQTAPNAFIYGRTAILLLCGPADMVHVEAAEDKLIFDIESNPTAGSVDPPPNQLQVEILTHTAVLLKFKPEATPEQRRSVRDSANTLPSQIPAIQSIITGETVFNPLGHGVIFLFESVAKLNEYRPHKAHLDFQAFVGPYVEDKLIFDIETA